MSVAAVAETPMSAVALFGSATENEVDVSWKKKNGFNTTACHVPRLSTVTAPTFEVASKVKESVCGSDVMFAEKTTVELEFVSIRRRGTNWFNGTPEVLTHTVSPTLNEGLGVEQSAA